MSAYDPELHEKLQKLESIEAHLAQHDKTVRHGMIWLSALGTVILALLIYMLSSL